MAIGQTHHIKLMNREYLVKPGTYWKTAAPQFGSRFSTGDPDWNNMSIWQHWAQKCFIGGMDAEFFADDAMYDDGVGVSTIEHDRVTLARDLRRGAGSNWTAGSGANHKSWRFCVYNNKLYVVSLPAAGVAAVLYEYDGSTDGWTSVGAVTSMVVRSITTFAGKLFIAGYNTAGTAPIIAYSSGSLGSWTTLANPVGVPPSTAIHSMRAFQQKLYVAYGVAVWRLKNDLTWDGNTVFYTASAASDSNYILSMEIHLGFLYMLSQNGHVHRTDGNSTFDLWNWDGQTTGVALKSFDGRMFVAVNEYADPNTPAAAFGALYQMSGSAMTQLKRWGKSGEYTGLGSLVAYDRKLFYGASNLLGQQRGFGIAVYDPVEDAHSIFASNSNTTTYPGGSAPYTDLGVTDVIYFGKRMYAAVAGFGVFFCRYTFKDVKRVEVDYDITAAGVQPGPQNGGWFTTSTYDGGTPGLRKLWRKIVIDYAMPSTPLAIVVEYSQDNGDTWHTALTWNPGVVEGRKLKEIHLPDVRSVSLKLRFTLRSADSLYTPIFYGFVVSYLPLPEPNWMWTFTIPLSEFQQTLDGTTQYRGTETLMKELAYAYRHKALIHFVDAEGASWNAGGGPGVLIYDFRLWLPDLTQPLEGELTLTLLEAIESI